jgi:hypothetical protein
MRIKHELINTVEVYSTRECPPRRAILVLGNLGKNNRASNDRTCRPILVQGAQILCLDTTWIRLRSGCLTMEAPLPNGPEQLGTNDWNGGSKSSGSCTKSGNLFYQLSPVFECKCAHTPFLITIHRNHWGSDRRVALKYKRQRDIYVQCLLQATHHPLNDYQSNYGVGREFQSKCRHSCAGCRPSIYPCFKWVENILIHAPLLRVIDPSNKSSVHALLQVFFPRSVHLSTPLRGLTFLLLGSSVWVCNDFLTSPSFIHSRVLLVYQA